jgi:DNA invertase Pin-like site-specific DNA recombinase
MGSMLFTIMAALAQMEHEIKSERVRFHQQTQRSWKGPWRPTRRLTDSQDKKCCPPAEGGEPAAQIARDLEMSRAMFYRRSRALTLARRIPLRAIPSDHRTPARSG